MPKKPRDERKREPVSLHIFESFADAWGEAVAPWFERVAPAAWLHELPSLIVVPTRGQLNALKRQLLEHGVSQLGLHFVTASALRELLDDTAEKATADLRLLLAIAATEITSQPNESEALAAKAIARSPGVLLRALERLGRAGWDFADLQMPSFAPVVRRFNELRRQCALSLPDELERRWLSAARADKPKFADLLITGFDGAHWPQWLLLQAAAAGAERATVVLQEPQGELSEVDLCWIGSWEEIGGEARRAATTPRRGEALFTEAEMRGEHAGEIRFDFLVGINASEQAEAIALQCVRYLADENCNRVGVVFAGRNALPRLVAAALSRLEIPHNDGVGHAVPGLFESDAWRAWIELQRSPRLAPLLDFVHALPDPALLLGKDLTPSAFEDVLRESYSEVLLDDLDVLREFCLSKKAHTFQSAASALRGIVFLPPRGTFNQFREQTEGALKQLNWTQQAFEIRHASRAWAERLDTPFSRALYLRWIEEIAASFGLARAPIGDHPYARLQLLTMAEGQGQSWSHLIFAGWNEGEWPPVAVSEFAREEEIRAFNRSVQQLNKRATRQGSQGEGHTSVREDRSLYLGPIEQRAIALRQFDALIESTGQAVSIAASLVQEDAPERMWHPNECFSRCYQRAREEPLTEPALKKLQRSTARWVEQSRPPAPKRPSRESDIEQTLVAFNARRDSSQAAGEYEFALRPEASGTNIPILSVSDLEQMVTAPALIWMKRFLGVTPPEDESNPWAATTGKWVHRWLARIAGAPGSGVFAAFPAGSIIDERVCASADERRALLRGLCDSLGKIVPDWWTSSWLNARYLARHLGAKVATAKDWGWMTAELPVGRETTVRVATEVELQLRGQVDLVFARNQLDHFAGAKVWILDYKTGSTKELKNTDLHDSLVKGITLQLGLYSLALRERGATEVEASIVSLVVKEIAPQLSVADLAPHTNVFADLAKMQRTGVFGMKGEIRPAFGFAPAYPLATLPIDRDVLEDKWALTHPNLVLEKEEWETW